MRQMCARAAAFGGAVLLGSVWSGPLLAASGIAVGQLVTQTGHSPGCLGLWARRFRRFRLHQQAGWHQRETGNLDTVD